LNLKAAGTLTGRRVRPLWTKDVHEGRLIRWVQIKSQPRGTVRAANRAKAARWSGSSINKPANRLQREC
jgi:hypothetical protein